MWDKILESGSKDDIVSELKTLSSLLIKCREVPRNFFEEFGEKLGKDGWVKKFSVRNPHGKGTYCAEEWNRSQNNVLAIILWNSYYQGRVKYEGIDEESIVHVKYVFERISYGSAIETITRITYPTIDDMSNDLFRRGTDLIKTGRNENFSMDIKLSEYEIEKGGIIDGNVKIIPFVPLKDAKALTDRFQQLLNEYKQ